MAKKNKIKGNTFDYVIIILIALCYFIYLFFPKTVVLLWTFVIIGTFPTLIRAIKSTLRFKISIDTFNFFALGVSLLYGDVVSSAFIVSMIESAMFLNSYAESKTNRAIEELFKLRPEKAIREVDGKTEEINSDVILKNDVIVIEEGSRIPVDGVVLSGTALINESSLTGESMPVKKESGDVVLSSTLNESGFIKIRATKVGADSTIEKMAELVKDASKNKSSSERLADRFAEVFLPVLLVVGLATYLITKNVAMVTSLFLVACADDMAVAIPLAITAAIGRSAKRGVIIKGGERIELLSKVKSLVVDKTGTLTYGTFLIKDVKIEEGISEKDFWQAVGIAEKFSEHPIGRAIFKEALVKSKNIPDPDKFKVYEGSGVVAFFNKDEIAMGKLSIITDLKLKIAESEIEKIKSITEHKDATWSIVIKNGKIMGFVSLGDSPRPGAKKSITDLKKLGIKDIRMFTGDNELIAKKVALELGIEKVESSMTPDEKLKKLEEIIKKGGVVAMVGDGVNDAAALSRADVGIAMGKGGSAVSVEAADIVILNDHLARIPEMVSYSRKVMSVIRLDMIIWLVSNMIGFGLVFTGIAGPTLAAFYNFATDFLPLINSSRLFNKK